ncbi:MAG: peptidoglycan DD-metalloendopeptidase family protein [Synergistaceae bacterium]|nr:peptidoglycan DD-metalloendopeptidase family protein [Synergistaceae bacterium]
MRKGKTTDKVLKMSCWVLIILTLIVACDLRIAWGAAASDIDVKIAAEERRRKELDQKLQSYRNSIRQMKVKENDLLVRIDQSQQATEKARQEMTILEYQINKLQKDIAILNEVMDETKNRIDDLVFGLKQRMVDIAKYGISEELLLIFSAETTHAVLDSIYLLDRLNQHDQFLISQLLAKKQEITLSQQTLEEHRNRLKQRTQSLEQERQKYSSTIKQTNTYLDDIRRQKALAERAAKEMEDAQKAVGQTILTLMRQKKEREAVAKKAGGKGSVDYLAGRITQGRGSMFDWPLRGPMSSSFGSRVHPVFKTKTFHSGMDISSPRGTPVKAAAPGEVLFEGWMRGYGQVVIIDHGRDYSTVYAHMSSTRVKEGTVVNAGTVIGTVGNTGTTTGYHLHFEVRVGSTAKNPLDYLKR